ncbi:MAG: M43 family zinc metalloprotease [Flavobacteriales bacterium]|nr:M43 family zinc metalloprotease [Flavobacteriales bacterium]
MFWRFCGLNILMWGNVFLARSQYVCGTGQAMERLAKTHPHLKAHADAVELLLQNAKPAFQGDGKSVRLVPVVFHVMHKNGVENISKEQILNALEVTNRDFRRLNSDTSATRSIFKPYAADMEIEFRLATIDPNGNCTDGITRHFFPYTYGANDNCKDPLMGGAAPWDQTRYLNVWVVGSIDLGDGPGQVAGYAYYPTWGIDNGYFGVVIAHRYLGTTGTATGQEGRTLTHEMGHIFGLAHTFEDGCGTTCQNSGDLVCDTPPSAAPTYGCNLHQSTCTNDALPGSPFTTNMPDQVENYMSYDACQNMFTLGQKQRTYNILNALPEWNALSSPSNLSSTGVSNPVSASNCPLQVDFRAERTLLCVGDSTRLRDLTWNGEVLGHLWQVNGPVSIVSNLDSPYITFNTPGLYSVTLTCTNNSGSYSAVKHGYIRVVDTPPANTIYYEDFEDNPFISGEWLAEGDPLGIGWQHANLNGPANSSACLQINNAGQPFPGDFWVTSPPINISGMENPRLAFDVAYARNNSTDNDRLIVQLSKNCGQSWGILYAKGKDGLASVPYHTSNFVPKPWEWRRESIKIPASFLNSEKLFVRFLFKTSGWGNNIYIDNIQIEKNASESQVEEFTNSLRVWPNPARDKLFMEMHTPPDNHPYCIALYDLSGREVWRKHFVRSEQIQGTFTCEVALPPLHSGLYVLVVQSAAGRVLRPLILEGP